MGKSSISEVRPFLCNTMERPSRRRISMKSSLFFVCLFRSQASAVFMIFLFFSFSMGCKLTEASANNLPVAESVSEPEGEATTPPDPMMCSSITYSAPSGSENDITFIFDVAYLCGQFANGDWWVSEGPRGYVQIDSIFPLAVSGLNGHEVNPSDSLHQGFDERIAGYDKTLRPAFSLQVQGNSSVVKAVSVSPVEEDESGCRPCLNYAAVLTVMDEPVPDSQQALRPSYFGAEKKLYRLGDTSALEARHLSVNCCVASETLTFESLAKRYQGVQLDHLGGWNGRYMHPRDNMPDYGASIARDNAVAVLRFLLDDFNIEKGEHKGALVNYLQMAVDLKGMALNGVNWQANGGHGNGRKLPLLFGGLLLDTGDFDLAMKSALFSEDEQVYWGIAAQRALFGKACTDAEYWRKARTGSGSRDCRDPYGYIDGGGHEVGSAYQSCCTAKPWKFTALAVTLLDLEEQWNNNIFLSYVKRWVNHGVWTKPDPCAPYNGDPDDYGRLYGPDGQGGCIAGGGRSLYPDVEIQHGDNRDGGHYGSEFGDELWGWYWRNDG